MLTSVISFVPANAKVAVANGATATATATATTDRSLLGSTFYVKIKKTFSKKYVDKSYGLVGAASFSRPVFSGNAAAVIKLNAFYKNLESKWKAKKLKDLLADRADFKHSVDIGTQEPFPTTNTAEMYFNKVTCKITYKAVGVISIVMDESSMYIMAAHGYVERTSHTFGTNLGRELKMKDVLKVTDANADAIVKAEFMKLPGDWSFKTESIWSKTLHNSGLKTKFYLGKDGVWLYFNPYEIGSYAEGRIQACVKYSRVLLVQPKFAT